VLMMWQATSARPCPGVHALAVADVLLLLLVVVGVFARYLLRLRRRLLRLCLGLLRCRPTVGNEYHISVVSRSVMNVSGNQGSQHK